VTGLLLAATLAAGVHAPPAQLIGRSVEGRPIGVTRVGDPAATRKILVVGCVHGDESAGRAIVAVLRSATPPQGTALLLVPNLNPDGFQHRTRANAHGVDLNRNSSQRWVPGLGGPRPWSEPESRSLRALILAERPSLTIYYHQPLRLVDLPEAGDPSPSRRYADLTGLPLHPLARYPGSLSRWQNARISAGSAFVVELPRGALSAAARARHAAAVVALLGAPA
jgi:murein peptide amidase A